MVNYYGCRVDQGVGLGGQGCAEVDVIGSEEAQVAKAEPAEIIFLLWWTDV